MNLYFPFDTKCNCNANETENKIVFDMPLLQEKSISQHFTTTMWKNTSGMSKKIVTVKVYCIPELLPSLSIRHCVYIFNVNETESKLHMNSK